MIKIFSPRTAAFRKALTLTFKDFSLIDGGLRAAAFAYYALFSLFPVVIVYITIGSFFVDRKSVSNMLVGYFQNYTPLNYEMKRSIFDAITGVVETRTQIGFVAFIVLLWGAMKLFTVLITGVNRAWGTETYSWWRLPLKNLLLLLVMASAIVIGIILPMIFNSLKNWWFPHSGLNSWGHILAVSVVPFLILFYGLSLFYSLAPRRQKHFGQVKTAAFLVTVLLLTMENLFAAYINNFAKLNLVYGTLGGIMALLMWIYFSAGIIILGACFSAAQAQIKNK